MVISTGYFEKKHIYTDRGQRMEQKTDTAQQTGGNGGNIKKLYVHEDIMGNTRYHSKDNGQSYAELDELQQFFVYRLRLLNSFGGGTEFEQNTTQHNLGTRPRACSPLFCACCERGYMNNKERLSLMMILVMLLASCGEKQQSADSKTPSSPLPSVSEAPESRDSNEASPIQEEPAPKVLREDKSYVFLERKTDATDDGVTRLIDKMAAEGLPFYQTSKTPNGLIASDDVVLLKINCQWAERGGTNTDLIMAVAEAVAAHPDGFTGEIVVADNGQGQYGTNGTGGSLDWARPNSLQKDQSALDVVKLLQKQMRISGYLWDDIAMNRVAEFADGDLIDGFIVKDGILDTGLEISYPKFTTFYGTKISFKRGIWDETSGAYQSEKLKVINMPVLKSHSIYHVTGAVKSYMGVVANRLTGFRPHNSVGKGGMGTLMANTRMPVLNIMDMVWVGAGKGPGTTYDSAVAVKAIAASTDPAALDYWAAKNILIPELSEAMASKSDPDNNASGSFGHWLRLSASEIEKAGLRTAVNEDDILLLK